MTRFIASTYTVTNSYRAYLTYTFIALSAVLAVFYAVNIFRIASMSVAVSRTSKQIASTSQRVQDLDKEYLDLLSRITPETVRQSGMTEGVVSAYITRTGTVGKVALSGHEL